MTAAAVIQPTIMIGFIIIMMNILMVYAMMEGKGVSIMVLSHAV